jgi:phospholipase C
VRDIPVTALLHQQMARNTTRFSSDRNSERRQFDCVAVHRMPRRDRNRQSAQWKRSISMNKMDRRQFMQLVGAGAAAASTLNSNIVKALNIPAHNRTGTIQDVEHIVILMQENRPFDHHFGTLRGVRGFNDPRAVDINLPLTSGGTALSSVFLQPAGSTFAAYGVPAVNFGGPTDGVNVIPPFRVNPDKVQAGLTNLGGTYLPGTGHGWAGIHAAWNEGEYDQWAAHQGPMAMSYMTRDDVPYHCALADAFTVADAYFCSVMGPTNPNRDHLFTGCIGNVNYLVNGTDGFGAGPVTYNGLSVNGKPFVWETLPEVLQAAGVSWKFYQDLAGATFAPDFGDGTGNSFAGNFGDNTVLYFKQYSDSAPGNPLFDNACTGTNILDTKPVPGSPMDVWRTWAESLFDQFRSDVNGGKLPQVSWIVAPAGYTEHSDWAMNYGAWYISHVVDILVSNPDVFSKTILLINYDEADGSFDHVVPPTPPQTPAHGASTVSIENEIVTTSSPAGPIGFASRVPFIAISPWSKGGYVNSQVFDHTSVVQFIEKRFGVHSRNITPWRRAVAGDLTSVFNFANPNGVPVELPATDAFLPSPGELNGMDNPTFIPKPGDVIVGVPVQETGTRPARALPYELDVHAIVHAANGTVDLAFLNTGRATVVFHVRSGNAVDPVRNYTVEPGKSLVGTWSVASAYDLSVYGPNGFVRFFTGSIGANAAVLDLVSRYDIGNGASIGWKITNAGASTATVTVLDAYTGNSSTRSLHPHASLVDKAFLDKYPGWYDLVVTVAEDPTFEYRLAGHVETGSESISDPALGGLVTLKA